MKRKIGELRNIPIVEGDKNLVREGTEIHINDLQSKGGSGEGGSKIGRYYKLNKKGVGVDSGNDTFYAQFKQENPDGSINITNKTSAHSLIIAVAMYPFGNKDLFLHSLEEYYTLMIKHENPNITDEELNNILKDEVFSKFTPITEEEFYKMD